MNPNLIFCVFALMTIFSCGNEKNDFDSNSEKVKIIAYQESQIGGIEFVLLIDNRFRINRQGLFRPEHYFGNAKIESDSIFLKYSDKSINFDSIPLPRKMKIENYRLKTDLINWNYYLTINKK
ncbi:hypothetical protein [Hanstruepera ponticola]|uniref:hypothetical protein n=1 Tax=Hanstruepera ponticola TaxID=2042995 RepID=UPI0013C4C1F2|nr:hypothetical protein [Hanstruepera ponticola]